MTTPKLQAINGTNFPGLAINIKCKIKFPCSFKKLSGKAKCANLTVHRQAGMFSINYATSESLITFLESAYKPDQNYGIILA
jgi:hypothetical protein